MLVGVYHLTAFIPAILYFSSCLKINSAAPPDFFLVDAKFLAPDRIYLEDNIFPYYNINMSTSIKKVLFVGVEKYTRIYHALLHSMSFWTIEPRSNMAKFARPTHHFVGYITDINRLSNNARFDWVILNGVYGWGLNSAEQVQDALNEIYTALNPRGHFLLGWNNMTKYDKIGILTFPPLFQLFEKAVFGLTGTHEIVTNSNKRHTFNFFIKKDSRLKS